MRKFLKIFGIVLAVILLLLFLTPFLFKSQLKDLVRTTINKNVNATVAFDDIDLSIFRSFPDATLVLENLSIINKSPFEGDTLATSEEVILKMSIKELFKGSGEPKKIDGITLNNTLLNIKIDSSGNANYDIAIQDSITTKTDEGGGFSLDVQHYEINNAYIEYLDQASKMRLLVEELDHEGKGDFSAQTSTLETFSTALVSFEMDSVNYLNRNKVKLDADFKMDLDKMRFTFLENEAVVNQLPLKFDGYVQINEDNNELDLSFKTPSSSFKNFLAVMPEEYSKNIENVQTSGDFIVDGFLRGKIDDEHIPTMQINIASNNASFKYPDLPKAVEDITIAAHINNETGIVEDTYVNLENVTFRIDEDRFKAQGKIRNLTENMLVDLALKGSINLANISKAYPFELEQDLNGLVTADLTTSFDMNSVEKEQYQNVKSSGTATIQNFSYRSPEIPNEVRMSTARLVFNPTTVTLQELKATTGQTDLALTGTLHNLMGYLFTDQKLKGNFDVRSDTFSVNDFMIKETKTEEAEITDAEAPTQTTGEEAVKVPSFLDANVAFTANKVLYDNLVLDNMKGNLRIVDETATLTNVSSAIFGGNILLNGMVSTKEATPNFKMKLNLNAIDIARSFNDMELLRNLAPIAEALQGKLTTDIDLSGKLNDNLTPQLQTLAGNALAQVLGAKVNSDKTPLLAKLDERLTFIDLDKLDLSNLHTKLTFNNGNVEVEPFDFNIKGVKGRASGSHGFDMDMNYTVALDIPAKFLGTQIGSTLAKLSAQQQDTMMVALPITITGNFNSPSVNLNLQQAVNSLTQNIIATQKDNLKEKGKDILTDILSGSKKTDSTATTIPTAKDSLNEQRKDAVKETAKDILGGLFGGAKKKKDTASNQ